MGEIITLLDKITEYYGHTASGIIMTVIIALYIGYIILRNYSSIVTAHLERKMREKDEAHAEATLHRKNITPKVRQTLSDLALEVNADRALLFEFSNGTSNLIGLPFLYLTATSEVVGKDIIPVSINYQRVNVSVLAEFLTKLECKGYFYAEDITKIKNEYPMLHNMFPPLYFKSVLFYSLMGIDDTIGFILIGTTGDNTFTRDEVLPDTASAAQKVSSYLNFDVLHEEL